jgi:transcriptional regulator with XRE-family HTH domain
VTVVDGKTNEAAPEDQWRAARDPSYNRGVISSAAARSDTTHYASFGILLRRWRAVRRVSQLHLALEADISTRHLSCVETGRAQPSREMVLRLAEALQVPLRERNALLLGAGYAPFYRHTGLDAPEMEAARHAVDLLMRQQEPFPGIVVDRYWNTLRMNAGTRRFLGLFPGCDSVTPRNGIRLVFHPGGLRKFIENWESVAGRLIQRVHREIAANPSDETMKCFLKELLSYPDVPYRWRWLDVADTPSPLLTINYRWNNSMLRLFSMLTTFSTAQDIALQELRVESFFPADEATRTALTAV